MASKVLFPLVVLINILCIEGHLVGKNCGQLPYGRQNTATVYDGDDAIFYIGGYSKVIEEGPALDLPEIVKYVISTKIAYNVGYLPEPLSYAKAAMDTTSNIFFFGGLGTIPPDFYSTAIYKIPTRGIDKYKPIHVNNFTSNEGTPNVVSVNGGTHIYLIGDTTEITRYDTIANTLQVVGELPIHIHNPELSYDGQNIFIFGGQVNNQQYYGILKYNLDTNVVEVLDTILTTTIATATYIGNNTSIIYGWNYGGDNFHLFQTFDHQSGTLEELPVDIELDNTFGCSSVYVGQNNKFYLNGGEGLAPFDPTVYCIDLTYA